MTAEARAHSDGGRRRVIAALGVIQILAWGSSYYLLAVLAGPIAEDTGWPYAWVIAGVSLGLLVAGAVSIRVGRAIEEYGGRRVLAASAVLLAAGLLVMAEAPGVPVYLAAWLLLGAGMGAGLYDAAFSTLGRLYGAGARERDHPADALGRLREHSLLAAVGLARRGRRLARGLPRLCRTASRGDPAAGLFAIPREARRQHVPARSIGGSASGRGSGQPRADGLAARRRS